MSESKTSFCKLEGLVDRSWCTHRCPQPLTRLMGLFTCSKRAHLGSIRLSSARLSSAQLGQTTQKGLEEGQTPLKTQSRLKNVRTSVSAGPARASFSGFRNHQWRARETGKRANQQREVRAIFCREFPLPGKPCAARAGRASTIELSPLT